MNNFSADMHRFHDEYPAVPKPAIMEFVAGTIRLVGERQQRRQ